MSRFFTVVRHSGYLFVTKLISRILLAAFMLYAAARLGSDVFGALAFSLAIVDLLSSTGDLGITRFGAREILRHQDRRPTLAAQLLVLQLATSLIFSLAGFVVVLVFEPGYPKTELLVLGLAAVILSGPISAVESVFIASENFGYSALLNLINRLVFLGLGATFLALGYSVVTVMWAFFLGVALEAAARLVLIVKKITPLSFRFTPRDVLKMQLAAIPFAISAITSVIMLQASVVVLEILRGDSDVGIYSIAFTIFLPFLWVPVILARTLLPGLSDLWRQDRRAAWINSWQWYRLLAILGVPIVVGINLLAEPLLGIFPSGYQESSTVLRILILSVPLLLVTTVELNILQVIGQEKLAARAMTISSFACVVFNFALVALFGVLGAATATVAGLVIREAMIYQSVRSNFMKRHSLVLFIRPLIAGVMMALVGLALFRFNPWLATGAGLVAYAAAILVTGGVRISELKSLLGS